MFLPGRQHLKQRIKAKCKQKAEIVPDVVIHRQEEEPHAVKKKVPIKDGNSLYSKNVA